MKFDLSSDELAEAMWRFIDDPNVYWDFCFHNEFDDMSIAEYCFAKRQQFREFCESKLGFVFDD